jgi:hypothetical protein
LCIYCICICICAVGGGLEGLRLEQEQEQGELRERLAHEQEELQARCRIIVFVQFLYLSREWHDPAALARLRLLQRDLVTARAAWVRRLAGEGARPRNRPSLGASSPGSEGGVEAAGPGGTTKPRKEDHDTTTVKKLISTILPHSDEAPELPPALAPDHHLITQTEGGPVPPDAPPAFVSEGKPSSLIAFLLSSPSYRAFLADSQAEGKDPHFVLEFGSPTAKFYCCSYFTAEFHNLRQIIFPGGDVNFVSSLENCRR